MLVSIAAGGTGINLQGANVLLFLTNEWNPSLEAQAAARIDRINQKKTCHFYTFIVKNTLDEIKFQLCQNKRKLWEVLHNTPETTEDSILFEDEVGEIYEDLAHPILSDVELQNRMDMHISNTAHSVVTMRNESIGVEEWSPTPVSEIQNLHCSNYYPRISETHEKMSLNVQAVDVSELASYLQTTLSNEVSKKQK